MNGMKLLGYNEFSLYEKLGLIYTVYGIVAIAINVFPTLPGNDLPANQSRQATFRANTKQYIVYFLSSRSNKQERVSQQRS